MGAEIISLYENTLENHLKLTDELDEFLVELENANFSILKNKRLSIILDFFIKNAIDEDMKELCIFLKHF